MDPSTVSLAALGVSVLVAIYAIFAATPKETNRRISKLEIDGAEYRRDYAALVNTVDRLAKIVDRYIEFRIEDNGRGHR